MDTTEICNSEDYIDSREIIDRIADLADAAQRILLQPHEYVELHHLQKIADECDSEDWEHGVTLIHEAYFEIYAKDLAWDIGAVSSDHEWPLTCIDWDQAAQELLCDYTPVKFNGVTYWYR